MSKGFKSIRFFNFKSIKYKLILYFSVILLFVTISLGFISYSKSSEALVGNMEISLQKVAKEASMVIEGRIESQLKILEQIAGRTRVSNPSNPESDKIKALNEEVERNGYNLLGFADMNGNIKFNDGSQGLIKETEYFKKGLEGKSCISDVILNEDKSLIMAFSTPIRNKGSIIGVLVSIRDAEFLSDMIKDVNFGGTSFSYVINSKGIVLGHKDKELVAKQHDLLRECKSNAELIKLADITENMTKGKEGFGDYFYNGENKYIAYAPVKVSEWSIGISVVEKEILLSLNDLRKFNIIAATVIILLGIIITYVIGRQITTPIIKAANYADIISKGDFTKDISENLLNKNDETGKLAKSLKLLLDNFRALIGDVMQSSELVTASSEELTATAHETALVSEEASKAVIEIAQRATIQAKNTEAGADKINELGQIIENDQSYMKELNESSDKIKKLIEEGLDIITQLIEKTKESNEAAKNVYYGIVKTSESSERIGEASNVIASISEKTNLLALNAAIEAARAGEQGKGFAVVADEIRKLAEQSTESTKVIDTVVKELQDNASTSVTTMENVGSIINAQEESVRITENKYNEISNAIGKSENIIKKLNVSGKHMEEQKENILSILQKLSSIAEENANGTEQVAASIEEQSASMNEIVNASQGLAHLAEELQKAISVFKI